MSDSVRGRRSSGGRFNVQKHAARQLHYDFRLELDGVLKSWAIPKGPSLDPGKKRLAIEVDDHSMEYLDFEGIIPDSYGAGTVMLWDRGTWTSESDLLPGIAAGRLEFSLDGEKLRGEFLLLRLRDKEKNWLLIKRTDRWAQPKGEEIVEAEPYSALTGRDLEQIASDRDRIWTGQADA